MKDNLFLFMIILSILGWQGGELLAGNITSFGWICFVVLDRVVRCSCI